MPSESSSKRVPTTVITSGFGGPLVVVADASPNREAENARLDPFDIGMGGDKVERRFRDGTSEIDTADAGVADPQIGPRLIDGERHHLCQPEHQSGLHDDQHGTERDRTDRRNVALSFVPDGR